MKIKGSFTEGKLDSWLLSLWHKPSQMMVKRTIALLISISFLFPTLSWAFDVENYLYASVQGIELGGPGSRSLALKYSVPSNLGKVVAADYQPGKQTFILIQDLHCHYEIQKNITGILDTLTTRHDDINLIAVEGGSGIIPSLELAVIPDSAAKRAVSDYFMKQGKLTGADYLVINDRPDLELYGAEDARLYQSSLALIQRFTTEENRGRVIEILDQLEFIQEKVYNPALLFFEKRRKHYLRSDADSDAYLRALVREANKTDIARLPQTLRRIGKRRELNYHEKIEQQQYLENALRGMVFRTAVERRLYQYQVYMELVERMINVSASREDLEAYRLLAETVSLKKITAALKRDLGGVYFNLSEEAVRLEASLHQALRFYQFADQRDHALYKNALQRIHDRGEQKVILITGGYHTVAIQEQISRAGYTYVTIQPDMSKAEAGTHYFELLRYPEQLTEFERIIAGQPVIPLAMAVRNFLTMGNFRNQFTRAVDFVNLTTVRMRESALVRLPGLSMERIRNKLVKFGTPDGTNFMGMLFKRRGMEILDKEAVKRYAGEPTLLGSNQVRVVSLAMLSAAILSITILPLLGIGAAVSPALTLMAMSLIIIAGWWTATNSDGDFLTRVFTKRNIILAVMAIGVFALPVISQVIMADVTSAVATGAVGEMSNLQLLLGGVKNIFRIFPEIAAMSPVAHDPAQALAAFAGTVQFMAMAPIFTGLKYPTIMGRRAIRDQKSSKSVLREEFSKLVADEIEGQIRQQNEADYGVRYEKGDARPAHGAFAIVPDQNAAVMLDVLVQNGLPRFEDDRVAIDFTIKDVVVKSGDKEYVTKIPTSSELLLKYPKRKGGHAEIDFRTLLVDPRFVDERGKPLYKELPKRYIKAVLNNFNPMMLYRAYGNELDDLLSRAGDQGEAFGKIIKYAAQQWKDKQTPDDQETLQEVVSMGMLHEFTHALALHLPDLIPEGSSEETKRDLEPITFDKYLELVMNDNDLITSVAFNKNLFKALREVKDKDPSTKTQGTINATVALEMFCDRFSMFLYQNYIKIQIYSTIFKDAEVPFSVDIDAMLRMETQRKAGQLHEMRGLKDVLSAEEFVRLETELDAAEKSHYFVSKFGDSALTANETEFFEKFLKLLKHFDTEKMIMRFTMDHANNSRFMRASVTGLTSPKALGVQEVVEASDDLGELAVNTFKALTPRQSGIKTIVDTETKEAQDVAQVKDDLDGPSLEIPKIVLFAERETGEIQIVNARDVAKPAAIGITEDVEVVIGSQASEKKDKTAGDDETALELLEQVDDQVPFDAASLLGTVTVARSSVEDTKENVAKKLIDKNRAEANVGVTGDVNIEVAAGVALAQDNFASNVVAPEANPDLGMYAAAGRAAVPSSFTSPSQMPYFSGADAFAGNNIAGDLSTAFQNQASQPLAAPGRGINQGSIDAMNQNAQFTANAGLNQGSLQAVPGSLGTGIFETSRFGRSATDWQAIPSRDIPGQKGAGRDQAFLANFNQANPELFRALGLPKDTQNQILAEPRIGYLLGKASQLLPMLPGNQPITFGFDSQSLADQMNAILTAMLGTKQGADLAGRIRTDVFPLDKTSGQRFAPSNWQVFNGIAVISDQMNNLRPVTVVLNADGNAAVAVPLLGIKKDKVNLESLQSIPGWEKILAASNKTLGQMRNQGELSDYYLVTAATIRELQQGRQGRLLSNLLSPVTGFQDVSNLTVQLPTLALRVAAQPAFKQGAKRVVMDINLAGLESLLRAGEANALSIAMFGTSEIISSSLGYNINSAFIQALLQADTLEAAPLEMVVEQNALESEYGVNRQSVFNQWFESLQAKFQQLLGKQAAGRMSKAEAEAQADELMGLDTVTLISRNKRLGEHLTRLRGRTWEQEPSLFSSDIYYAFKHGRMQSKPIVDVEAWNPKVEPTKHSRQRGLSKIFSALLLGFAAGVLVFDTFVEIGRTRDAQGKRISVFAIFRHPNFVKALQLMSMVIMGNGKAMDYLSPAVKQQINDLQKLSAVEDDTDVVNLQEREAMIDTLSFEQIPTSLKYSLGQFKSFKKMLVNHPIFKFLMRITGIRNIVPLYPELFVILSESQNMQSVMWYFAPAVTTRKNMAELDNANQVLQENLTRSVETAREEMGRLRTQLQEQQAGAKQDYQAMNRINSQIKDRRFTLLLNRALDNLGRNNTNRNIRRLIRVLLKELARRDVENAEGYQEDILKILSMLEPFQQVPVQIVLESGKKVQASIPASLNDTVLRDQLLFFLDVYDSKGQPMQPLRRKVLRAGASA